VNQEIHHVPDEKHDSRGDEDLLHRSPPSMR
jgi:hypothetical protein